MKNGLLLINLGTPDNSKIVAVRRYLREFLLDKRVIDLPALIRYLLVYLTILPFRPQKTAQAYQTIWTDKGSPLLVHSRNLQFKLQTRLGNTYWKVALGMRYGNPSIAQALNELSDCHKLIILPLYPQYSSAATGTSLEKVFESLSHRYVFPSLTIIRDFYNDSGFIEAQASLIAPLLSEHDYFLFSYHGIPERHLRRIGCHPVCAKACAPENLIEPVCYRAQCYATTRELVKRLNLSPEKYGVSFQSRLGKTPWIKPYTDQVLAELANKGIKRLAIACPSFVTDCLETLEEIGIRAKKQWQELGGQQLTLIPAVNDGDLWVEGLIRLINENLN
ncbi:ferrochelatase [Legionella fairfieldensis]|uniref:ferrochelatase n=1 Tax=Legionella fairfieldensis TaxID=45064 RepID=UPI0004907458|nr:ferrochelatase [Legionella fairfieldensis]